MEDNIKKLMDKEYHEFTTNSVGFIEGFLSRRKDANEALKVEEKKPHKGLAEIRALTDIAEIAAFYNRMFNAAIAAFKGNPAEFIKELEGGGK